MLVSSTTSVPDVVTKNVGIAAAVFESFDDLLLLRAALAGMSKASTTSLWLLSFLLRQNGSKRRGESSGGAFTGSDATLGTPTTTTIATTNSGQALGFHRIDQNTLGIGTRMIVARIGQ